MGLQMPGVVGYNPAMWDKVIDAVGYTVAVAFTASGKAKMRQRGWDDAVDGKVPQFGNPWYMAGYASGQQDLAAD